MQPQEGGGKAWEEEQIILPREAPNSVHYNHWSEN